MKAKLGEMDLEQNIKDFDIIKVHDSDSYHVTHMHNEIIIQKLKERGGRITKQRMLLLGIIMDEECSSCKEIYYKASKIDPKIGIATVYRMLNTLEEIGAISRKNMYKIACSNKCELEDTCTIEIDINKKHNLSAKKWYEVIQAGLKACGYTSE